MASGFNTITYDESDASAIVTINRPEKNNALNAEAKLELIMAIREANKESSIRSIILSGSGRAFCTGQDLNDRQVNASNKDIDLGHTLETEWNPLINSIRDSKKIIIGALNGTCAGAGVALALACDLLVAGPEVKFISAFSRLALVCDAGSTYGLVRSLGRVKTMEFCLLNTPLGAQELLAHGLINSIDEDPMNRARALASHINGLSLSASMMTKKNIQNALDFDFSASMAQEVCAQRYLGKSNDYKEGLSAFMEKRTPLFSRN